MHSFQNPAGLGNLYTTWREGKNTIVAAYDAIAALQNTIAAT